MRYFQVILFLILLVASGCGLKRDNPLDPVHPGIVVPEIVSNVTASPSPAGASNKYVNLAWTANSSLYTDGYYVYRGLGFYSTFTIVDTVMTNSCTHGSKPWHSVSPGEYYYKVSAYKTYGGRRLEGRQSLPAFVRVPI